MKALTDKPRKNRTGTTITYVSNGTAKAVIVHSEKDVPPYSNPLKELFKSWGEIYKTV